jgi:transmembrane sensor
MSKEVPYNLLAKYFSGNSDEQEKLQVEQWKKAAPANEVIFREYENIWKNAQAAKTSFTPDVENALEKVDLKLGMENRKVKQVSWMYYSRRVAAVFLIVTGCWAIYQVTHKLLVDAKVEVFTLQGEKKEVRLPDGSHVWLNSSGKLTYATDFKGRERKITLEGEAYFEVSKDPSRPFIIEAGNSVTTVLGTAFNLRARRGEDNVIVTVTEGKVAFVGKDPATNVALKLKVGDKGILNLKRKQLVLVTNEDPNFLSWKTGKLIFKNTPLVQVADKLTDFYGTNIRVVDPAKAAVPFTSTFDHQSLRNVIIVMEMSLGVKADTIDHVIVLK